MFLLLVLSGYQKSLYFRETTLGSALDRLKPRDTASWLGMTARLGTCADHHFSKHCRKYVLFTDAYPRPSQPASSWHPFAFKIHFILNHGKHIIICIFI